MNETFNGPSEQSLKPLTWFEVKDNAYIVRAAMATVIEAEVNAAFDPSNTECLRGDLTLRGVRYVVYSQHNVEYYGEHGALCMISKADWIRSLTPAQIADIYMLGLIQPPAEEIQSTLDLLNANYR